MNIEFSRTKKMVVSWKKRNRNIWIGVCSKFSESVTVHRSKLLLVRKIVFIITYLGFFLYNDARNTLPNLYIVSANVSITTKRLVAASFPNNKARDFEKCVGILNAAALLYYHHTHHCVRSFWQFLVAWSVNCHLKWAKLFENIPLITYLWVWPKLPTTPVSLWL